MTIYAFSTKKHEIGYILKLDSSSGSKIASLLAYKDKESIAFLNLDEWQIKHSKDFAISDEIWEQCLNNLVCVCDLVYDSKQLVTQKETDIDIMSLHSISRVYKTNKDDFIIHFFQESDGFFDKKPHYLSNVLDKKEVFQELQRVQGG